MLTTTLLGLDQSRVPFVGPLERFPRRLVVGRDFLEVLEIGKRRLPLPEHRERRASTVKGLDARRLRRDGGLVEQCEGTIRDCFSVPWWCRRQYISVVNKVWAHGASLTVREC